MRSKLTRFDEIHDDDDVCCSCDMIESDFGFWTLYDDAVEIIESLETDREALRDQIIELKDVIKDLQQELKELYQEQFQGGKY